MYQDYKLSEQQEKIRQFFMKWLRRETRREIVLPVSVSEAKDRIQNAFADNVKISGGFFAPTYLYTGQAVDNTIDIRCSISGRSTINYTMHGEIFSHPAGSRLLMVIKDENYWSLVGSIMWLVILITLQTGRDHILVFVIAVFGLARHRLMAEENMTALLNRIINKNL